MTTWHRRESALLPEERSSYDPSYSMTLHSGQPLSLSSLRSPAPALRRLCHRLGTRVAQPIRVLI
jgi:hypothetical protein